MKTITSAVRSLMRRDEVAREAARRGILNNSAYAREIIDRVAQLAWKEVEEPSVMVSVGRVSQENRWPQVKPTVQLQSVSVETGLVDVTFERTTEMQVVLSSLVPQLRQELPHDLYIESTGQRQVTMIMTTPFWERLSSKITQTPLGMYTGLAALSLSFERKYLEIPNFIYAVLGIFALENINLMEIVSTMTEIVIMVKNDDVDTALKGLRPFLKK